MTAVDLGRERHYQLVPAGLAPVRDWIDGLSADQATPRFGEHVLDALDLEIRRTVRDRDSAGSSSAGSGRATDQDASDQHASHQQEAG